MSKVKRIFICILSGLIATAIAVVAVILVVNHRNSNNTESRNSKQDKKTDSVSATPSPSPKAPEPTVSVMDGIAEAGKGRFAEIMQLLLESKQYSITAHYAYDIGEGEQVTVTQEYDLNEKEQYCRNTSNLSTGEALADLSYLYDTEANVLYLIEDKKAVTMGDHKLETGGVFAEILMFLQSGDGTLELVRSYTETLDGEEMTAEAYRYSFKKADAADSRDEPANGSSGSGSSDDEDVPLVAYFDRDGNFIAFESGSILCYAKVEIETAFVISTSKKSTVLIGEFSELSYEDATYLGKQLANSDGPVVAHKRRRDESGLSDEEIVARLWEAQNICVEIYKNRDSIPSDARNRLSEYYTAEAVDELLRQAEVDPFYNEFNFDAYSIYYQRGIASFYQIRKNSDSDYTIFVEGVTADAYDWKRNTYILEIHYRKDGDAWHFDGYLPRELRKEAFRKGDANSIVYRMVHGGTPEQAIKNGNYAEWEEQRINDQWTDIWTGGILIDGDEIKVKFINNEQEEWGAKDEEHGYAYDCYILNGFTTQKNTIGEYNQLKDTVYQINFSQAWENFKEDNYEYDYGFSDGSCCVALVRNQWREAEVPKQSSLLLFLAGTDRATINEVMLPYDYVCPEEFYTWNGYDMIDGQSVLPVDLVFLIFDGRIVYECYNFTREDCNSLYGDGLVYQGETSMPDSFVKIKPDGNETEVYFSDASFTGNQNSYDSNLALLGSILASAAYQGDGKKGQHIYDAYINLGFESDRISLFSYPGHKNNEKNVPNINSEDEDVGFSIASKKQANGRYLVMITIRGSEGLSDRIKEGATQIVDGFKYFSSGDLSLPMMAMQEAFGLKDILVGLLTSRFGDYRLDIKNDVFTLQRVPTHHGFAVAMMDVVYGLDYYVKKHPEINEAISQGKVDFFVTGHSLGGSVTNLLCATFLNALQENGNKVFGYSMAAPKTIHFFEGYSLDGYDNIWNIVIPEDFIPTAYPGNATNDFPTVWIRYGNDRYITYTGNLDTHHSYSYIAGLLLETQ